MEALWTWLNDNNGAVIAATTVVYAVLTSGLWWQTRQQARVSRSILEASQRPYLRVEPVFAGREVTTTEMIEFHFHNHGSVPAVATWWRFDMLDGDAVLIAQETERPAALCVFPGQAMEPKPLILGPLLGVLVRDATTPRHVRAHV